MTRPAPSTNMENVKKQTSPKIELIKNFLSSIGFVSLVLSIFFFFNPNIVKMSKPELLPFLESQRGSLIGKWKGTAETRDGGFREWTSEFQKDGSYRVTFFLNPSTGEKIKQIEEGFWGVSGPVYFTIIREITDEKGTKKVDSTYSYYYDAYKIEDVEKNKFTYTSLETGHKYTIERVRK